MEDGKEKSPGSWFQKKSATVGRGWFRKSTARQTEAEDGTSWVQMNAAAESPPDLWGETPATESDHLPVAEYRRLPDNGHDAAASRPSTVRWLNDESSPYGLADEDGTLKQLESSQWRRFLGVRKNRGFVAVMPPAVTPRTKVAVRESTPTMSPWLVQSIIAIGLVGAVLYASKTQGPVAGEIRNLAQSAFAQDYSQQVLQAIEGFITEHHIPLPVFARADLTGTMRSPIDGGIQVDYSVTHPEIWFSGTANAPVYAAGAGTVVKVDHLSSGIIVAIDHGPSTGVGWYIGLATASVKAHEYVSIGQIIGRLPKSAQHPVLRFGIIQNGEWHNPHDFIELAAKNGV